MVVGGADVGGRGVDDRLLTEEGVVADVDVDDVDDDVDNDGDDDDEVVVVADGEAPVGGIVNIGTRVCSFLDSSGGRGFPVESTTAFSSSLISLS